MDSNPLPADLVAVARAFPLLGQYRSGAPFGSGHINDTFAVVFDQAGTGVRYLLQRINDRVFTDVPALMDNIQRVTAHAGRFILNGAHVRPLRIGFVTTGAGQLLEPFRTGQRWLEM